MKNIKTVLMKLLNRTGLGRDMYRGMVDFFFRFCYFNFQLTIRKPWSFQAPARHLKQCQSASAGLTSHFLSIVDTNYFDPGFQRRQEKRSTDGLSGRKWKETSSSFTLQRDTGWLDRTTTAAQAASTPKTCSSRRFPSAAGNLMPIEVGILRRLLSAFGRRIL